MVVSGKDCPDQASVDEVAEATIRCLKASVPASLPGIVFLSGGQSDEAATAHHERDEPDGSAPVAAVVLVRPCDAGRRRSKLWSKDMVKHFGDAQKTVAQRARENGLAALGQWKKSA